MATFKGLLLTKDNEQFKAELADIDEKDMPEGDVVVRVEYSTLNYKDALAITSSSGGASAESTSFTRWS